MSDRSELDELVERLTLTGRLSEREARHLVEEVLAFLQDSIEQFARRQHRELQREGLSNDEIFGRIRDEAARRRFSVPALSVRRVRRLIYG